MFKSLIRFSRLSLVGAAVCGIGGCQGEDFPARQVGQVELELATCSSSPDQIRACVSVAGVLRVLSGTQNCSSAEKPLCWNQVGPKGSNRLVAVGDLPVGDPDCPAGGSKLTVGVDTNANAELDAAEVAGFAYVCNDAPGAAGPEGGVASGGAAATGPVITTTSLPGATLGTAYTATLTATSVTGSATWSISRGSLPAGLSMAADGTIAGTPSADGTFTVVVTALDGSGIRGTATLSLTVKAVVRSVSAGYRHTCVVLNNGRVKCWGVNALGQLGDGTTTDSFAPVQVLGVTNAKAVAASQMSTCALLDTGAVVCWGDNSGGQLGTGNAGSTQHYSATPVPAGTMSDFVGLSHDGTVCGVTSTGSVYCWGARATAGSNLVDTTPTVVAGLGAAVSKISGGYSACGIVPSAAAIQCWGGNDSGELGNDTTSTTTTPSDVIGLAAAPLDVSVGVGHSCAVVSGGALQCWGSNRYDQLGVSSEVVAQSLVARTVSSVSGVVDVVAGPSSTCALLGGGSVACWGDNTCDIQEPCGLLGNVTATKSSTPATVWPGTRPGKSITLGGQHACLVAQDGAVYCWGYNGNGQLGTADATLRLSATPVKVDGI
jgi:alpha-tubulin suppressor-like RCC1 family protein